LIGIVVMKYNTTKLQYCQELAMIFLTRNIPSVTDLAFQAIAQDDALASS